MHMLMMSSVMEMQALRLRFDALRILQATLCGSATNGLWNLLENFFGVDENVKDKAIAEAKSLQAMLQKHKEDKLRDAQANQLKSTKGEVEVADKASAKDNEKASASAKARRPVTPAPSDDESVDHSDDEVDSEDVIVTGEEKQLDPKSLTLKAKKEVVASVRKYPRKCALSQADLVYPVDEDSKHQTGVDKKLIGYRQKLAGYRGAYECLWKDCDYAAQTRGVVCSHLRRVHLGKALGCPFCPKKAWFQTRYWANHMEKEHPAELWYVQVELPKGPLVAVAVPASELFISEEHLIVGGKQQQIVKIEPKDLPPDEEEEVYPPSSQKRRRIPSSSEEDVPKKKKVYGIGREPTDEECAFKPSECTPATQQEDPKKIKVEVHVSSSNVAGQTPAISDSSAIVIEDDTE